MLLKMGRRRWQQGSTPDDRSTCWVPVMARAAGPTRGVHVLPRIGQEVLVGFLSGGVDVSPFSVALRFRVRS